MYLDFPLFGTLIHTTTLYQTYTKCKYETSGKLLFTMASSSPISISFLLLLLLLLPSASSDPQLSFHGGLLLTGNVNLSLIWYGRFGRIQKSVLRSFIKSLNNNFNTNLEPPVSEWWQMVESYQSAANDKLFTVPKIRVRVVRQVTDVSYSIGKVITKDFLSGLVSKGTNGDSNTVAVVFTSREVTVQGLCMGKCSEHGVIGNPKLHISNI